MTEYIVYKITSRPFLPPIRELYVDEELFDQCCTCVKLEHYLDCKHQEDIFKCEYAYNSGGDCEHYVQYNPFECFEKKG